jgi:hypothetical protein
LRDFSLDDLKYFKSVSTNFDTYKIIEKIEEEFKNRLDVLVK